MNNNNNDNLFIVRQAVEALNKPVGIFLCERPHKVQVGNFIRAILQLLIMKDHDHIFAPPEESSVSCNFRGHCTRVLAFLFLKKFSLYDSNLVISYGCAHSHSPEDVANMIQTLDKCFSESGFQEKALQSLQNLRAFKEKYRDEWYQGENSGHIQNLKTGKQKRDQIPEIDIDVIFAKPSDEREKPPVYGAERQVASRGPSVVVYQGSHTKKGWSVSPEEQQALVAKRELDALNEEKAKLLREIEAIKEKKRLDEEVAKQRKELEELRKQKDELIKNTE
jgi:hypothetical protein